MRLVEGKWIESSGRFYIQDDTQSEIGCVKNKADSKICGPTGNLIPPLTADVLKYSDFDQSRQQRIVKRWRVPN